MIKRAFYYSIVFIIIVVLLGTGIAAVISSNETTRLYALRPSIEVVNWGGKTAMIRFPYQDYKYILDYSNPYEYIVTDAGYDLVIHFGRFERID